jgi:hypothetical protein
VDEEYQEEGSALQNALEQVIGETAAGVVVDARESTTFSPTEMQATLFCTAILIFALGSFFKGLKGGPVHVATESFFDVWKEERAERRAERHPRRRKPEDQPQED